MRFSCVGSAELSAFFVGSSWALRELVRELLRELGVRSFMSSLALHRALRRMAGLVFIFCVCVLGGSGGRVPKARRRRVCRFAV